MWWFFVACDLESPPSPGSPAQVEFDVRKGATARGLADELADAGLVRSASNWEWFLRLGADGSCLKAGKHRVGPAMTAVELLAALCAAPVADDVPFTVVEGWRIRDIDAALTEKGWMQAGDYIAAARSFSGEVGFPLPANGVEGYLYPETYMVSPDRFEVQDFIRRQLDTFGERWGKSAVATPGARAFADVVIVASMVEREERTPENRPTVAGIMWKRLDGGWNLGIDATSRYTIADWNSRDDFMVQLRNPADPYNTRLRAGLPPTAIGNPGLASLEAAAHATEGDFWYYLHDSSGKLHPSRTAKEHEALRRKYNVY